MVEKACKQVAMLDYEAYFHDQESNRRVYSVEYIAPTVTAGGGTHVTKVLIPQEEERQERIHVAINSVSIVNRVYFSDGLCPCQRSSQWKDPIRVVIE